MITIPEVDQLERKLRRLNAALTLSEERVAALEDANAPSVIALAYETNWADYGSPYVGGGYFKDSNGVVHLEGLVRAAATGTIGQDIAILPVGYRPPVGNHICMAVSNHTTAPAPARVDVLTTGQIRVMLPAAVANNGWFSLAAITFWAGT